MTLEVKDPRLRTKLGFGSDLESLLLSIYHLWTAMITLQTLRKVNNSSLILLQSIQADDDVVLLEP